jgi:hypothetical protein
MKVRLRVREVRLTDFERDVAISVLSTALSAWEEGGARQNAAARVIKKLIAADTPTKRAD